MLHVRSRTYVPRVHVDSPVVRCLGRHSFLDDSFVDICWLSLRSSSIRSLSSLRSSSLCANLKVFRTPWDAEIRTRVISKRSCLRATTVTRPLPGPLGCPQLAVYVSVQIAIERVGFGPDTSKLSAKLGFFTIERN